MHAIYNEDYYLNYGVSTGTVNYLEAEDLISFLRNTAKNIVDTLHPKTVLDAGCATGHLVAALRDLGVEAYGIDISDYAISVVREDIRQYCAVGSLVDPIPEHFPKKYDVVITIEVLEHLMAEEGKKAIANLCQYTDRIIFASTPDDFDDPTHINVQPREYWARIFAECGFMDDLHYRPLFLASYASSFYRSEDWLSQFEHYERLIVSTQQIIKDKDSHIQNLNTIIQNQSAEIQSRNAVIQNLHGELAAMANSRSWRVTALLRSLTNKLRANRIKRKN